MNKWWRVGAVFITNLLCVVVLWLPVFLINRFGAIQIRGFEPSNAANALPYKPDTVSPLVALAVSLSTALIPMIFVELLIKLYYMRRSGSAPAAGKCKTFCNNSWVVWVAVGRIFAVFFAGYAITGIITDMCKYMAARPRPSFLNMCLPDYTKVPYQPCLTCGNASHPGVFWPMCLECPYIPANLSTIVCQQTDWYISRNMWLSFPSGHSSYTVYAGTFGALYLYERLGAIPAVVFSFVGLRPLIVFASSVFSIFVCLSRVSDDRHHVSDVIVGAAIGMIVSVFCAWFVAFPSVRNLSHFVPINNGCDVENGKVTSAFLENGEKTEKSAEKPKKSTSEQATPF